MNEQRDLEGISALATGASSGIGSMAGQVGLPGGAVYSATKGALVAMTRSWMRGTPRNPGRLPAAAISIPAAPRPAQACPASQEGVTEQRPL
jgi:hypothetical protein